MFKIAMLLPKEYMLEQAKSIAYGDEYISEIRLVNSDDVIKNANELIENGVHIIIARGLHALKIKNALNVQIAEIVLTGQELGLAIIQAKNIVKKEKPKITIIALENMVSDTSYFNEMYDIELDMQFIESEEEIHEQSYEAIKNGTDILIGGDTVGEIAMKMNFPYLFLKSTKESISNAIDVAKKMVQSAIMVKNHIAEVETILDTSAQGIIKFDNKKYITVANKMAQELIKTKGGLLGNNILKVVPELNEENINLILDGKQDIYSTSIRVSDSSYMVTLVPIKNDDEIYGVIATLYRLNVSNVQDSNNFLTRNYRAKVNFKDIVEETTELKYCVEMAKIYALSSYPILIYGEIGTQKDLFAQAIHNNSAYKDGPFIYAYCAGMTESEQFEKLFGTMFSDEKNSEYGALEKADMGTVYISEIDKLSLVCQYRLYRVIKDAILIQKNEESKKILNTRIIVTSSKRLDLAVKAGEFRSDLYYALNALVLTIPPARERKYDIEQFVNLKSAEFAKKYSKFIKVSKESMEIIVNYKWDGNFTQIDSFCERLFHTTKKRLITPNLVQFLIDELYAESLGEDQYSKLVVYKHPEAKKIINLLDEYNGSRKMVAKDMNISTSTLWRRMKKYGIVREEEF